jgi:hypothetical protein
MLKRYSCHWCAVVLLLGSSAAAVAQGVSPLSDTSGYAGTELSRIYRQSVGTGYSSSSLNQITLNNLRAQVPNVGQSTVRRNRVGNGLTGFNANKPFSNYSPSPTISPYLNLFREDLEGGSDFNYQTLVRPQIRQQELNQQLQQQNFAIAQRLQAISAQSDFNPQGSESQPPTGHQTVFQYYGHFYPALGQRRR